MFNISAKKLLQKLEKVDTGDKSKDKIEKIELIGDFAHGCYDDGYNDGFEDGKENY